MKRITALLGLVVLSLPLTALGLVDAAARGPDAPTGAVDVVVTALTHEARADFESPRQVRCVARRIVELLGVDRLEQLGLDTATRVPPRLMQPGLTERDRDRIYAAYDDCLFLMRDLIVGYVREGFTEPEARCIAASYRATGIPRVHLTEAPHGESLVDTEEARIHLDTFLEGAKLACRDWL